jgi:hypothetical protein
MYVRAHAAIGRKIGENRPFLDMNGDIEQFWTTGRQAIHVCMYHAHSKLYGRLDLANANFADASGRERELRSGHPREGYIF